MHVYYKHNIYDDQWLLLENTIFSTMLYLFINLVNIYLYTWRYRSELLVLSRII